MSGNEHGSVTIVAAALLAMVVVLTMGASDLGRVLLASSRAQTAADASALAAAQQVALPSELAPQGVAAEYAAWNRGQLVSCLCDPPTLEATVTVRVPVHGLFLVPGTRYAVASARAVVRREGPLTGVRSVAAGQPVGNLLWGPGRTMPQPWRSTLAGR
ncbi:MAG TPA: Rv3654c family TadE-like protein [Actinomycetota bacterium]|nr:Rv3654c family TadE-like protein [Actinomycetota bacterium]